MARPASAGRIYQVSMPARFRGRAAIGTPRQEGPTRLVAQAGPGLGSWVRVLLKTPLDFTSPSQTYRSRQARRSLKPAPSGVRVEPLAKPDPVRRRPARSTGFGVS